MRRNALRTTICTCIRSDTSSSFVKLRASHSYTKGSFLLYSQYFKHTSLIDFCSSFPPPPLGHQENRQVCTRCPMHLKSHVRPHSQAARHHRVGMKRRLKFLLSKRQFNPYISRQLPTRTIDPTANTVFRRKRAILPKTAHAQNE